MAVWASFVESFFDGDHEVAHTHNPLLERYVPAMARFVREAPAPLCHVRYETLVKDPEAEIRRLCEFLALPFDPGMVDYGKDGVQPTARGLGDPITVARETRPTDRSLSRWIDDWAGQPEKVALGERILASLADEDLATWGFTRAEIESELARVDLAGEVKRGRGLSRYTLERKLVVALRRNIHHNAFGRLVRRVRDACDILLR
jgi:hypothetical protein